MYECDRCSTVSTLLFISNGTPVRVHVWEETIIVMDGAHTQLGAFTILLFFPPNYFFFISFHLLEFVFVLFFLPFTVFFFVFHTGFRPQGGHCTHLDVSNQDFIDRISNRDTQKLLRNCMAEHLGMSDKFRSVFAFFASVSGGHFDMCLEGHESVCDIPLSPNNRISVK